MYAAYQSHQSCGGVTASKDPCRMEVSFSSSARAATAVVFIAVSFGFDGLSEASSPARSLAPVGSLVVALPGRGGARRWELYSQEATAIARRSWSGCSRTP